MRFARCAPEVRMRYSPVADREGAGLERHVSGLVVVGALRVRVAGDAIAMEMRGAGEKRVIVCERFSRKTFANKRTRAALAKRIATAVEEGAQRGCFAPSSGPANHHNTSYDATTYGSTCCTHAQ